MRKPTSAKSIHSFHSDDFGMQQQWYNDNVGGDECEAVQAYGTMPRARYVYNINRNKKSIH